MEKNIIEVNGKKLHLVLGRTKEEWLSTYFGYPEVMDFSIDIFFKGLAEIDEKIWYWLIDGRCYETIEKVSDEKNGVSLIRDLSGTKKYSVGNLEDVLTTMGEYLKENKEQGYESEFDGSLFAELTGTGLFHDACGKTLWVNDGIHYVTTDY